MRYPTLFLASMLLACSTTGSSPDTPNNPSNMPADPNQPIDPQKPVDPAASLSQGLTNGSRLRHRYIVGADGTVAGIGYPVSYVSGSLYDTQLSVACRFDVAEDGQFRCLPAGLSLQYGKEFLDSACTQRLATYDPALSANAYYGNTTPTKYAYDSNNLTGAVYSLSEVTPATIYVKNTGTCTMQASPPGIRLYLVGNKVPATDFVAGTFMN